VVIADQDLPGRFVKRFHRYQLKGDFDRAVEIIRWDFQRMKSGFYPSDRRMGTASAGPILMPRRISQSLPSMISL